MKKIISSLFILLFSLGLSAQKCKYDFDKKDKFTGGKITGYKYKLKTNIHTKLHLKMYKKGSKMVAELFYYVPGELNQAITEGRKINIRLDNDEIITLSSKGNASPKSTIATTSAQATVTTTYTIFYPLSKSFIEKLSKYKPLSIQVELFDNEAYAEEVKKKQSIQMKEDAICLLKLFP